MRFDGLGNICSDLKFNNTTNGNVVVKFRLAEDWTSTKSSGKEYISVEAWNEGAEALRNAGIKNGDWVALAGFIRTDSWDDPEQVYRNSTKAWGPLKHYMTKVVLDTAALVSSVKGVKGSRRGQLIFGSPDQLDRYKLFGTLTQPVVQTPVLQVPAPQMQVSAPSPAAAVFDPRIITSVVEALRAEGWRPVQPRPTITEPPPADPRHEKLF